jgi:diadenylate cyclase
LGAKLDILKQFLDVTLVAYLIYRILLFSRGTRAIQVIVLLLGFLGLSLLAKQQFLDLVTFRWLLDKVWYVVPLVLAILYQDDIRRSLSRFRWTDALFRDRALTPARSLEELIKAVRQLSSKRIGALIVLERSGNLEPFMAESGIRIEGFVSKGLLFALFLPSHENPTHDGAVIVGKDRILAAGVILPITNRVDLENWVGTRHRAAIGLSERVDAVVVVVSEETGRISVAIDGELKAGLSPDELRQLLSHEIRQSAAPSVMNRLRRLAIRHRGGEGS